MRVPVTRYFDTQDFIGYLSLRDDMEILPDHVFALSYIVLEQSPVNGEATKIQLQSISLIPEAYHRSEEMRK